MANHITVEAIEKFVNSTSRFSLVYASLREHLGYCSRCRRIFQEIASVQGLDPDVDKVIFCNFLVSDGALKKFASNPTMIVILGVFNKKLGG